MLPLINVSFHIFIYYTLRIQTENTNKITSFFTSKKLSQKNLFCHESFPWNLFPQLVHTFRHDIVHCILRPSNKMASSVSSIHGSTKVFFYCLLKIQCYQLIIGKHRGNITLIRLFFVNKIICKTYTMNFQCDVFRPNGRTE